MPYYCNIGKHYRIKQSIVNSQYNAVALVEIPGGLNEYAVLYPTGLQFISNTKYKKKHSNKTIHIHM